MSIQKNHAAAFDLGMNARESIRRAKADATEPASAKVADVTSSAQRKKAAAKPSPSRERREDADAEGMERFQAFLPRSVKRRLKVFAATEDMTLTKAMEVLLTDALARRGA